MQRTGWGAVVPLVVALGALALAACGDDDEPATTSVTTAPPATSATTEAATTAAATSASADPAAAVDALLAERVAGSDRMWQRALTPRLPSAWPPAADTTWVTYAYATAFDPQLADGVHVSAPFARIVESPGSAPSVEPLGGVEEVDVQGVTPLGPDELAALQGLGAAEEATRGLTAEPAPDDPRTATIRSGYGAWLAANGAIAGQLPDEHDGFLAWVAAG